WRRERTVHEGPAPQGRPPRGRGRDCASRLGLRPLHALLRSPQIPDRGEPAADPARLRRNGEPLGYSKPPEGLRGRPSLPRGAPRPWGGRRGILHLPTVRPGGVRPTLIKRV